MSRLVPSLLLALATAPLAAQQASVASAAVHRVRAAATEDPRAAATSGASGIVRRPAPPYPAVEPASMRVLFVEIPTELHRSGGSFYLAEPGEWRTLGPRAGFIDAGDTSSLAYTLMVPAQAAAGENEVGIVRFVPTSGGVYYDVPLLVDVVGRSQVQVEALRTIVGARAGERIRTEWQLTNSGNVDADVTLRFTHASGWRPLPPADGALVVPHGSSITLPVMVDVPSGTSRGDYALMLDVADSRGRVSSANQHVSVADAAVDAGAAVLQLRAASAQDDRGTALRGLDAELTLPLPGEARVNARLSQATLGGGGLVSNALGSLGFARRLRYAEFQTPETQVQAGNVGNGNLGLVGQAVFGDGVVARYAGDTWRGSATWVRPVYGDGEYLAASADRRVRSVWTGVAVGSLADRLFEDRYARTIAAQATMPLEGGTVRAEAGLRETPFGSGAALRVDASQRFERWGYSLAATHAPGGAAAFAQAEDFVSGDVHRELRPDLGVSAAVWSSRDHARATRAFQALGWSARGQWRAQGRASLSGEIRSNRWDSSTPLGDISNGELLTSLTGSWGRGLWNATSTVRAGTFTRSADLLSLGAVLSSAPTVGVSASVARQSDFGAVAVEATWDRTGGGVGLPSRQAGLTLRADGIPLWQRRVFGRVEHSSFVLGATGARLDAQSVGIDAALPANLSLRVTAERNALFRRFASDGTPWVLAMRVQHTLGVASPFDERALGRVFLDRNGNGRFDRGDEAMPGILVQLGGSVAVTDRRGKYRGAAGSQMASVDVRSLPPGVIVAPRTDLRTGDIALQTTAPTILRLEWTNPARLPVGDVDLSRAVAVLRDARGRSWSSAVDARGEARFDALPVGRYQVEIDASAVGDGVLPLGPLPAVVVSADGGRVVVLQIGPRPLRMTPLPSRRRIQTDARDRQESAP